MGCKVKEMTEIERSESYPITTRNRIYDVPSFVLGPSDQEARIAIYFFYSNTLGCPSESAWYGNDGAISVTMRIFPAFGYEDIRRVFKAVDACNALGIKYDGSNDPETAKVTTRSKSHKHELTTHLGDE